MTQYVGGYKKCVHVFFQGLRLILSNIWFNKPYSVKLGIQIQLV